MATLRSKFHKVEDLQHSGNISHVQQYVNYARYALTHTKDSLGEAMIKEHLYKDDLPLYVVNLEDVKQKQYQWAEHLPKITAHYAVKCNPDPHICEELAKLGCGFDCASQAEMELIISLGVDPGRIIYAHPCKPYSHLKRAQELGVDMMVFDSKYELEKIQAIHPEAKLLLRLAVDNSYSLHPLSNKFGVRFKHVPELLEYAFSLNLNVIGVSFHVGSKVTDPKAFTIALQEVRKVFDMAEKYGFEEFTLLDIGGGFPGNWEGEATTLPEIAVGLNKIIPQVFPKAYSKVRVIAEPGRYMVSSCASVITTVIGKREETLASGEHKMIYYLNEGLYGCFNNIIFDDKTPKPHLLHQPTDMRYFRSTFYGPTCDSIDKILEDITFPLLEPGERLCFPNMGAYSRCAASEFNGFERAQVVYLSREKREHPSAKARRKKNKAHEAAIAKKKSAERRKRKKPKYVIRSSSTKLQKTKLEATV